MPVVMFSLAAFVAVDQVAIPGLAVTRPEPVLGELPRLDSLGVTSSVVIDLKRKELMNCPKRIFVSGCNANSTADWRRLKRVRDCSAL